MNLDIDDDNINFSLDQMVKEGLRLYLQGSGVQIIYYLKFLRNKHVERLLMEKFNPENYISSLIAKNNMIGDNVITQKNLVVPYEIKVEKRINENFYSHPWQTNYVLISEFPIEVFNECTKFIEECNKK